MILVLLGTQNNSFHRLLEEIEKNIKNGKIKDKVIVQAGFTKFESNYMEIFDLIPQQELDELLDTAKLIITHGGVGSIMGAVKRKKKVIAVPRLKEYEEHVNDHQREIVESFAKEGYIIGINEVEELSQALSKVEDFVIKEREDKPNKIITLIDNFIQETENRKK